MTQPLRKVTVYNSSVNYHNGEDIGQGFGVILEKPVTNPDHIFQIADAIRYALENLKLHDE